MKITLFLPDKLVDFKLPSLVSGNFSFDSEKVESKLINVIAKDNQWFLYQTEDVKIVSNKIIVKDNGKYYSLDSRYQIASEVPEATISSEEIEYIYNTNDNRLYVLTNKKTLEEINNHDFHGHNSHLNYDGIIVKEAIINEDDITESNSKKSIDYEDIKFTGKCGLYHHTERNFICECKYSKILDYSDGFSAAKRDTKAGFVNEYGEELMFEYEETRSVHSGCAFVKQDGKWGILKIED